MHPLLYQHEVGAPSHLKSFLSLTSVVLREPEPRHVDKVYHGLKMMDLLLLAFKYETLIVGGLNKSPLTNQTQFPSLARLKEFQKKA